MDFEVQPTDDDCWFTEKTDDGECIYSSKKLDLSMEDVYRMRMDLFDWNRL